MMRCVDRSCELVPAKPSEACKWHGLGGSYDREQIHNGGEDITWSK